MSDLFDEAAVEAVRTTTHLDPLGQSLQGHPRERMIPIDQARRIAQQMFRQRLQELLALTDSATIP